MKLEKWALIAEIGGGLAIVVTLVILIFEVRANTELSRIASYEAVTRDFDEARRFRVANPEAFDLFFRFNFDTPPDFTTEPEAAMKLQLMLLNSFAVHERSYLAYQAGIVGEEEWSRLHRSECAQWAIVREHNFYFDQLSFRLTDSYVDQLQTNCD